MGKSLGAAMAGLSEINFEDLMDKAVQLSLATRGEKPRQAWSVHPLLGELLRERVGQNAQWMQGMTGWFLERLPQLEYSQHEEQGKLWKEIGQEGDALVGWLGQMPVEDMMSVVVESSQYADLIGPFAAWMKFGERVAETTSDPQAQSFALLILARAARSMGSIDKAIEAANKMARVDRERGDDRGAAIAIGILGDIFQARGDLDEALRIRRDEQVPVYERLGDVRSLLIGRAKLALNLLSRNHLEDRAEATDLLRLALRDADAMGIPEAAKIRTIQRDHNLT